MVLYVTPLLSHVKYYKIDNFAKMSAKLIVRKYENDNKFKCLDITIEDEENHRTKAQFGQWSEGKVNQKKKESEKSARLVVKIISGLEVSSINLDTCAKQLDDIETRFLKNPQGLPQNDASNVDYKTRITNDYFNKAKRYNSHSTNHELTTHKDYHLYNDKMSPLEYGLEKVKETNACIMENIQMLNRTLNYTKKREILDNVCPKSSRTYPCTTCGKCFVYETGLKRHCAVQHAIIELQPRWQVVWTCIECFQVWPTMEVALKHSIKCCKESNGDCVREIKTSSLLQCEFCEKVFTSIPRLLRHCKIHTTACNYQCNACKLSFSSYKSAEKHWLLCPWLRMYYTFSLPKLLLCNACDRKFRNYEQLYNHRYKVGHFIAKSNHLSGIKQVGLPLYQCETCGQCFPSTTPLHLHKNQYHPRFDVGIQNKQIEISYG